MSEFICAFCSKKVSNTEVIGSKNRNHCPYCLHSLHLDLKVAGDRLSDCKSIMDPVGLTFKNSKSRELMLIHVCRKCHKIDINRIAGDDDPNGILKVFENSLNMETRLKDLVSKEQIYLAGLSDVEEINRQMFGN